MEIREVADSPEDARSFRDNLKAWKNRGADDAPVELSADEARAEDEGMLAPVEVDEDDLDSLEDDVLSFEAAEEDREAERDR